jgi:uncharacterized membrane protein
MTVDSSVRTPTTRGVLTGGSPLALVVVPGVITAGTLLVAFSLLALGVESFWVTFVIGFGVVLPVSIVLTAARVHAGDETGTADQQAPAARDAGSTDLAETDTALATLRSKYARGEITDAEFERRVGKLLETGSEPPHSTRAAAGPQQTGGELDAETG